MRISAHTTKEEIKEALITASFKSLEGKIEVFKLEEENEKTNGKIALFQIKVTSARIEMRVLSEIGLLHKELAFLPSGIDTVLITWMEK